jgi:phenylacetate-CoA ligase
MVKIFDIFKNYKNQKSIYQFLKKSQYWDEKELLDYQLKLLSNLLAHSYNNVPYYRKIFDFNKIKPQDINSIEDLQKIPFLTREIIIKNKENLKAKNYPKNKFVLKKTGGTTGEPLSIYIEKGKWLANHLAYNRIFMDRAGYKRNNKSISILGINRESRYHPLFRTLELSSFYITEKPDLYIQKIKIFKPKYIISYPSAIAFLSKYILEKNMYKIVNIKGIFCHGEPLYGWELEYIQNAFNCKVFDIYGHGEKSVLAATCEKSNNYHVFTEYCIVELIDNKGNIISKDGEIGEIVATGLYSHIFPFIRYKTGDLGIYSIEKCECGRKYPIIKSIIGRINEFLISKNEELIHLYDINKLFAKNSLNIKKWQILQEEKGNLILSIITDDNFTKEDYKKLENNFYKKYKKHFNLKIRIIDKIKQTGSSKHHFLIQKLPVEKIFYNS